MAITLVVRRAMYVLTYSTSVLQLVWAPFVTNLTKAQVQRTVGDVRDGPVGVSSAKCFEII